MEPTILNLKQQFLLGAGLDVLHFESKEWLSTIALWKDEVKFFEHLLKQKESSKKNKPEYEKMLKSLDKIYSNLFDDLEDSILAHEKLLSRIEKAEKGLSDDNYREKHKEINKRISVFENDFNTFKKIVFDYAKKL